jgi:hypothetical protein
VHIISGPALFGIGKLLCVLRHSSIDVLLCRRRMRNLASFWTRLCLGCFQWPQHTPTSPASVHIWIQPACRSQGGFPWLAGAMKGMKGMPKGGKGGRMPQVNMDPAQMVRQGPSLRALTAHSFCLCPWQCGLPACVPARLSAPRGIYNLVVLAGEDAAAPHATAGA